MPTLPGTTSGSRARLRIAVNDDSMSTWFIDATADFCIERALLLDVVVDDQDHTAERIRAGDVQGAVTTQADAAPGWRSVKLGRMRYRAVCSPGYFKRYFAEGLTREALRRAPCVNFNEKDELQKRFVRRVVRADIAPPAHFVPHGEGFLRACTSGTCMGHVPATASRVAARKWRTGRAIAGHATRYRSLLAKLALGLRLARRLHRRTTRPGEVVAELSLKCPAFRWNRHGRDRTRDGP